MATCIRCGSEFERSPRGRTRKYCSDDCKRRAWDYQTSATGCADCGQPMSNHSASRGTERCWPCFNAWKRERHEIILSVVEGCWADGWPAREIAAVIGRGDYSNAIGPEIIELRKLGRAPLRHKGSYAAA